MPSQNESTSKVRNFTKRLKEVQNKNKKLQTSNEKLQTQLKNLRLERNKAKRQCRNYRKGRDNWKQKCQTKRTENEELNRHLERGDKPKGHHYARQLILLAVLLRCTCGCSYRKIHEILDLLNSYFNLGFSSIPCANTIQNWVSKAGYYELKKQVSVFKGKEVSIIMDECLRLGKESILLILMCSAEKLTGSPLSYHEVEIFSLRAQHSWTAEEIQKIIMQRADDLGVKVRNIISDEERKLKRTALLMNLPHIPDISHLLSTCLRQAFAKREEYILFLKVVTKFHQKCYRHQLNWMRPALIGIKARFMNQKGLINWGLKILDKEGELELSTQNRLLLQPLLEELRNCRQMLLDFSNCLELNEQLALLFKNEGLSFQTITKARISIRLFEKNNTNKTMKIISAAKAVYVCKLNSYIDRYEKIADLGHCYNACSDVIESIFGVHKSKINQSSPAGLTPIGLEIPLLCTNVNQQTDINHCLEEVSMSKILEWRQGQPFENQRDKRRQLLKT